MYITRGSQSTELDGASGLLHLKLDVGAKPMDTGKNSNLSALASMIIIEFLY